MDIPRCQSCGMPMKVGYFGTKKDGSQEREYCKFCYVKGEFTDPNLTLKKMIELSTQNMTQELKMPENDARKLAEIFIPVLKRWQKV